MDRKHEQRASDFRVVEFVEPREVDDKEALLEYISVREKEAKLESVRWSGYCESHPATQILDIMRESTTILRKHNGILLALGLILAVPLSTLLLSGVLLHLPVIDDFVRMVQLAAEQRFKQQSHHSGYRRLAESMMSNLVDIPFSALFSPLLKAGVAYVVASTYTRKRVKLAEILETLQKVWLLLVQTFLWTCSVYITFASAFVTLLWLASRIGEASTMCNNFSLLAAALVGLALAAGLAISNVMCNLAYVVTILEGTQARQALMQSVRLLKGRFEVALLLFLVTNVNATMLDVLFEFHIIRNADSSIAHDKYWEAPLLVYMHSFVHLFDAIMISVLYYVCKSSEMESRGFRYDVEHLASPDDLQEVL
ncbi:uncharacterized protein [Physcomitrium patens]|uniref:Uncharacterized protein n=1 Tax=Physcomitrium patens TaxID=3218 RepID=A0A2K1JRX0_PHYPA|nr:uncharacterized protein LOC112290054 isoform X2 [Physcomitrium patens]PNR44279.1 hypothetical protein PHYPA_016663 [Physcomitrium patens]|eukprot:XP_024391753.1 uncharacterized protein LOC112290054 isoform X2 [Physcomitrella patens]